MKENKKYFFTYVKKKQNDKGKIGPFIDKEGNTINDTAANILQNQYRSVWSQPRSEDIILNIGEYFDTDTSDNHNSDSIHTSGCSPKIDHISFTRDKIRKAIMGVKIDAAPGPDGITPVLMKMFCDQILEPLEIIFLDSFEDGFFQKSGKSWTSCRQKSQVNQSQKLRVLD